MNAGAVFGCLVGDDWSWPRSVALLGHNHCRNSQDWLVIHIVRTKRDLPCGAGYFAEKESDRGWAGTCAHDRAVGVGTDVARHGVEGVVTG